MLIIVLIYYKLILNIAMKKGSKPHSKSEEDDRFKQVFTDPRFMQVPKKIKKVEIDDRFKKGMTSKEFNSVSKVDKYGKKVLKQDNTMAKFYNLETKKPSKQAVTKQVAEESEEVEDAKGKGKQYYDEDGNFKWEA